MDALPLSFKHSSKQHAIAVAIAGALITFLTYASVYAFRKPFTVSSYDTAPAVFGVRYKDALVICQVFGYMLSKFYGIKYIAELKKFGRPQLIFILVLIAWAALFLFAVTPAPYNVVWLFINGFPLGIIWGVIFSFVEGRKATDFIGAALAVSFIFSSGFVKSIAQWLTQHFAVSEWWLPFFTGLVFIVPLTAFLFLLNKFPQPTAEDIALRVHRPPMDKQQRRSFLSRFKPGLVLLIITYVFLTIFRDIRDNFAADIWQESRLWRPACCVYFNRNTYNNCGACNNSSHDYYKEQLPRICYNSPAYHPGLFYCWYKFMAIYSSKYFCF
jgi:MFS family permease